MNDPVLVPRGVLELLRNWGWWIDSPRASIIPSTWGDLHSAVDAATVLLGTEPNAQLENLKREIEEVGRHGADQSNTP